MKQDTLSLVENQVYFDNWRKLSPLDNAIMRVIETHGGEIRQAEIAEILGVADRASISRPINKLANLGLITITKYGRTNSYTTIFFGSKGEQHLTATIINQSACTKTILTTDKSKDKKSFRDITEKDIEALEFLGLDLDLPLKSKFRSTPKTLRYGLTKHPEAEGISNKLHEYAGLEGQGLLDWDYSGEPMTLGLLALKIADRRKPNVLDMPPIPEVYYGDTEALGGELSPACEIDESQVIDDCQDYDRVMADTCQADDFAALVGSIGSETQNQHLNGSRIIGESGGILTVGVRTEQNAIWLNKRLKTAVMRKISDQYDDVVFEVML